MFDEEEDQIFTLVNRVEVSLLSRRTQSSCLLVYLDLVVLIGGAIFILLFIIMACSMVFGSSVPSVLAFISFDSLIPI